MQLFRSSHGDRPSNVALQQTSAQKHCGCVAVACSIHRRRCACRAGRLQLSSSVRRPAFTDPLVKSRDFVRCKLYRDRDGTAELIVDGASGPFRGRGSAWFSVARLAEFAHEIEAFPLPAEAPELAGGYWCQDGTGIEQQHLRMRVAQIERRGVVGIQLEFATPVQNGDRTEGQSRAAFEVRTDYAALGRFAHDLARLASGDVDVAELVSTPETAV